jgi:hypothetical protein
MMMEIPWAKLLVELGLSLSSIKVTIVRITDWLLGL